MDLLIAGPLRTVKNCLYHTRLLQVVRVTKVILFSGRGFPQKGTIEAAP